MPDLRSLPRTLLIRGHSDVVLAEVGTHHKDWFQVFTGNPGFRLEFIPMKIGAGMTTFIKTVVYGQTLIRCCHNGRLIASRR
jgi:hypothetical protein